MQGLKVSVVGVGSLGQHHARILSELPRTELVGVYDVDANRCREIADRHEIEALPSVEAAIEEAEAVVVAVPTVDHGSVGERVLRAGRHLLVEKPMADSLAQAQRLLELSGDRVLAVGHVEFYNPAVTRLLELGEVPRFVEVQRLSAFTARSLDVDVVLDLMIHDLQIIQALDPSPVRELRAAGIDVLTSTTDIADVRLELESGCIVKLTASRVSDQRLRTIRVFFGDEYYSLDYQAQTIKGFRLAPESGRSVSGSGGETGFEGGTRQIVPASPEVVSAEPLRCELECFVDRCLGGDASLVDGAAGYRALESALEIVETIQRRRDR